MAKTTPEQRAAKAAYMRSWLAKHRDSTNAERRAKYEAHREVRRRQGREYRAAHIGRFRAADKLRNARPDRIAANRERSRKWAQENRGRIAERVYGMAPGQYAAMVEAQGGKCAVCLQPPSRGTLHVDHDHATGQVRGLLCQRCNVALGLLLDDPRRIAALMDYAERGRLRILGADPLA